MLRGPGILRLLTLDCIRGYRPGGQGTTSKPESLSNRLRLLRSIPTDEGGSTHRCHRTAGYPVTPSLLWEIAICARGLLVEAKEKARCLSPFHKGCRTPSLDRAVECTAISLYASIEFQCSAEAKSRRLLDRPLTCWKRPRHAYGEDDRVGDTKDLRIGITTSHAPRERAEMSTLMLILRRCMVNSAQFLLRA